MKQPTMEQKWHKLYKEIRKLPLDEAEQLGLPCQFQWVDLTKRPIWMDGFAVCCFFGPRGGRYIVVRCMQGTYKVQWLHVKWK